jgi:hypothetical protein
MYGQKEFGQFLDMVQHSNDVLHHVWFFDQSIGLEYVGPSSSMDVFTSYM